MKKSTITEAEPTALMLAHTEAKVVRNEDGSGRFVQETVAPADMLDGCNQPWPDGKIGSVEVEGAHPSRSDLMLFVTAIRKGWAISRGKVGRTVQQCQAILADPKACDRLKARAREAIEVAAQRRQVAEAQRKAGKA